MKYKKERIATAGLQHWAARRTSGTRSVRRRWSSGWRQWTASSSRDNGRSKDLREIRKILALKMASIREMDAAVEALLERRRQIEKKSGARSHKAGEQRAPKPR